MFRQLVTHGWAEIDVTAYGALHLTQAARPVLRGEVPALLREQLAVKAGKSARTGRGKATAKTADGAELSDADEALYDKLKAWRLDTARTDNVPAFVILHDSVLREIARSRPGDKAALAAISGIGERKLERFGEAVIEIVTEYGHRVGRSA